MIVFYFFCYVWINVCVYLMNILGGFRYGNNFLVGEECGMFLFDWFGEEDV